MREIMGLAMVGIGTWLLLPALKRRVGSRRDPVLVVPDHHVDPPT